jgi:serine protease AprX
MAQLPTSHIDVQSSEVSLPSNILAITAGAVLTALVAAAPAAASGAVESDLARVAHSHPRSTVSVIVEYDATVSRGTAVAEARHAHGRDVTAVPLIHGVAMRTDAADAVALAHARGVRAVSLNAPVSSQANAVDASQLATAYDASVNATRVWASGFTGAGVTVGVIDTGIDGNLPDFQNPDGTSRVVESAVITPTATTASDLYGHGTHVAGIIAGDSHGRNPSDPDYGRYIGVAPGANLVSIKIGDDSGHASVLDVIDGIAFAISHRGDTNLRVLNLSLQSTSTGSYSNDPLDAAVEAAWANGIVVVAAAGNNGTSAGTVDHAPSNDPFVISVGAVDDHGTADTSDDTAVSWSSYGTTVDGVAKPEISAPGSRIVSVLAPGSAFGTLCPSCVVDSGYFRVGGTSMAAPVVSGAAALLLQKHPGLTPDQVKSILVSTANRVASGAAPEVDARAAATAALGGANVNAGLTPNTQVAAFQGLVSPTASSWAASSWSTAPPSLTAGWAASSWSCTCAGGSSSTVAPSASSWSASSWSASSWSTNWNL